MSLQQADGVGSIRWTSDVFSKPPPTPRKSRRIIGMCAAAVATGVLVVIVVNKPARDNPIVPLQMEMVPSPRARNAISTDVGRRKLRDPFPSLAGFSIVKAQDLRSEIRDEEFVIGVELESEARAYTINMMGRPESELLNDTLASQPIAVSFCNSCQSPLVFSRRVEGQTLTFFLSGELLSSNMIMKDSETGTEWVQLTGEAIQGPLEGHWLEQLPAVWTDWKTWRQRHPETTAPKLPRVVENYRHHTFYSTFPAERSFFSTLQWGLARGDQARSWPYAQLARQSVVDDFFAGEPLLVLFDDWSSTPTAFKRRLDDTELTFRLRGGELIDDQTVSSWDTVTGQALKGPLKGRRLRPVPGTVSLDWAWRNFHPNSATWSAEANEKP